jgi:putative hemolysin
MLAGGLAIAIVVVSITIISLILGGLIPKRLGLLRPEAVASAVAGPMAILAKIALPLVSLPSAITEGAVRLLTGGH